MVLIDGVDEWQKHNLMQKGTQAKGCKEEAVKGAMELEVGPPLLKFPN